MADAVLRIAAGSWEADILPALGGAILSLRRAGRDVLRPSPADPTNVLETACFPLVPYANRIAYGRFSFGQVDARLPRNFGDHPHSLHGVGWRTAWMAAERAADYVVLRHDHEAGAAWPWRYRATQTLRLSDAGFSATLALTNADRIAMPAGVGFHPYFPVGPGSTLRMRTGDVWLSDIAQLPIRRTASGAVQDWSDGAGVLRSTLVDHCYTDWIGEAVVESEAHRTHLSADGAPFVHVHIPPGQPFVGIEPVSHMPDAVNRPEAPGQTGLCALAPGDTLRIEMRITAS